MSKIMNFLFLLECKIFCKYRVVFGSRANILCTLSKICHCSYEFSTNLVVIFKWQLLPSLIICGKLSLVTYLFSVNVTGRSEMAFSSICHSHSSTHPIATFGGYNFAITHEMLCSRFKQILLRKTSANDYVRCRYLATTNNILKTCWKDSFLASVLRRKADIKKCLQSDFFSEI